MSEWFPLPRFRYITTVARMQQGVQRLQQEWQEGETGRTQWRDVPTEVVSADEFNGDLRLSVPQPEQRRR